jgi:uncharacterized ubiquitin-like protein YukD
MKIYKALLKYGYSNFKLEILEYCDLENLVELLIQVLKINLPPGPSYLDSKPK